MAIHPNPKVRVAYVAYELTSQVAAFALDEAGLPAGPPLPPGPICVLDTFDQSDELAKHMVNDEKRALHTCSDATTTIAALRVAPNGLILYVSNRVVGGDGLISALRLYDDGKLHGIPSGWKGWTPPAWKDPPEEDAEPPRLPRSGVGRAVEPPVEPCFAVGSVASTRGRTPRDFIVLGRDLRGETRCAEIAAHIASRRG